MTLLHATAVARDGQGVLLLGPPGAGKSDLALRLIDRGWLLVSDDQVELRVDGGRLLAAPPRAIAGKLEVRGIGIVDRPFETVARIILAADLAAAPERLPEPATREFAGVSIPIIALEPFAASAPIKLELAFAAAKDALKRALPP